MEKVFSGAAIHQSKARKHLPNSNRFRLFFLTFSVLLFQINLTRIFSYIFPYHFTTAAIGIALVGLGGGALLRARSTFIQSHVKAKKGFFILAVTFILNIAVLYISHHFALLITIAVLTFIISGVLISEIYEYYGTFEAHKSYFFDLTGAAIACLLAPFLISVFGALRLVIAIAGFWLLLSAQFNSKKRALGPILLGLIFIFIAGFVSETKIGDPLLKPDLNSPKNLKKSIAQHNGQVIHYSWNSLGRSDLFQDPSFPNIRWLYINGMASTMMLRAIERPDQVELLKRQLLFAPFAVNNPDRVLLIGPGAGMEIVMAKISGASFIDAVEINSDAIKILDRYKDFAGPVYNLPGVRTTLEDGRKFLATTPHKYDLIQMALAGLGSAQAGSLALVEGYLFTKESLSSAYDHLTPSGMVAFIEDSYLRAIRLFLTSQMVIQEKARISLEKSFEHLSFIENDTADEDGYRYLILLSKEPLIDERAESIALQMKSMDFKIRWLANDTRDLQLLAAIHQPVISNSHWPMPFNVTPITDDRPFYFDFTAKFYDFIRIILPMLAVALTAFILVLYFFLSEFRINKGTQFNSHLLALLLGIGFMFIELSMLHRLFLLIGHPTNTLSVVLFSMLLFCGIGSRLSIVIFRGIRFREGVFCLISAFVSLAMAIWLQNYYLLPSVPNGLLRLSVAFLVVAPIGLFLGMPFPSMLNAADPNGKNNITNLWGMNGLGSVIGAVLFMVFSFRLGFHNTHLIGVALYITAGFLGLLSAYQYKPGFFNPKVAQ